MKFFSELLPFDKIACQGAISGQGAGGGGYSSSRR